ncbi:MAG: helix-turn-helix domain-containing protein [Pseudoxanthomonas sp.]|nr:MAG: helix-turn-helix domain-containing protein [Pseudoxanthomonas sp.]
MSALAQRLAAARKAAGVSQLDAGKHINVSRPTYIAIEKGRETLSRASSLHWLPCSKLRSAV